jgi:hypothetical protein
MFELFFKYPMAVFSRGTFVFLGGWPKWALIAAILVAAAGFGLLVRRMTAERGRVHGARSVAVWLLQTALASILLLMLWHPALSVATLRPQQNIVAVVVDDSASMATRDADGSSRREAAERVLNSGLIDSLQKKFQVRLYRLSDHLNAFRSSISLTPPDNRRTSAIRSRKFWPTPPACRSARWFCCRMARTIPAESIWRPFPRFAASAFPSTRSGSGAKRWHAMSN